MRQGFLTPVGPCDLMQKTGTAFDVFDTNDVPSGTSPTACSTQIKFYCGE